MFLRHAVALVALSSFSLASDPQCVNGILASSKDGAACCAASCGSCGAPNCADLPGGESNCCASYIITHSDSCASYDAPCVYHTDPPPTSCGHYPAALASDRPNVLLIGDSISMAVPFTPGGYGVPARRILNNASVNVWHSGGWDTGGQASNTVKGLRCTNASTPGNWLNISGEYDVVHFNFGLHDLVDPGPGEGAEHVELAAYGANLAEIYSRLSTIGKQLVWTSTTPCPNVTTSMGRSDAKVRAYNQQARASLLGAAKASHRELLEDDLYAAVDGFCGRDYKNCSLQRPANVHFEPAGQEFMGKQVARSVIAALKHRKT